MHVTAIFFIMICLGISTTAMELEPISRLKSDECDIENQRLVVPELLTTYQDSLQSTTATKLRCIRKSGTYCQLLANLKQLPPRLQNAIAHSINEEIKDWKTAIADSDHQKIHTLFDQLEHTFIRECKVPQIAIFQSEPATCCGFNTAIIERSFTREFGLQLRAILELNNLEQTKELASVFKKWRLYFSHLSETAHSEFLKKYLKEAALTVSPAPLPIGALVLAANNYNTLAYIALGLTAGAAVLTQVAIRKFGVLSAYKPLCIHEELVKVQLSIMHFEHAIRVHKAKLNSIAKISNALQLHTIQRPFCIELEEELKRFDEIGNETASTFPTNLNDLKAQRDLIIRSLKQK